MANEPQKPFLWADADKAQAAAPAGGKPFLWGDEGGSQPSRLTPEALAANKARNAQPTQFEKDRAGDTAVSNVVSGANQMAGKALSAAGLPTSIKDIPNWTSHLAGTAKDSQPVWQPIANAIKNPTQENLVGAVPLIGAPSVSMSHDIRAGHPLDAAATLAGTIAAPRMAAEVPAGARAGMSQLADTRDLVKDVASKTSGHSLTGAALDKILPEPANAPNFRGGAYEEPPRPAYGPDTPTEGQFRRSAKIGAAQRAEEEAAKPVFPGASLPSVEDFHANRLPELGSPDNPGFHSKLPTRMPAVSSPTPELGSPENPGFHSKVPTRMPEQAAAPSPEPELGSSDNPGWHSKVPTRMPKIAAPTAEAEAGTPRIAAPSDAGPRFTGNEGRAATWTNDRVQQLARQGDRTAIQQMVRRGMELPENARYVAGDPNFSAGVYNPRDVTTFSPEGTPIRQGGKQLSRISTGESRPEPEPRWAYRAHDEGNPDFDLSRNNPHATLSPEEAMEYREARGNQEGAKPQTVSRTNLNLVPDQFEQMEGPRGNPWVKFRQQQKWEPYKP